MLKGEVYGLQKKESVIFYRSVCGDDVVKPTTS